MQFDQPAFITECEGCGGKHSSGEQWVACLLKTLAKVRANLRSALTDPDTVAGRVARLAKQQSDALPCSRGGSFEEQKHAGRKGRVSRG